MVKGHMHWNGKELSGCTSEVAVWSCQWQALRMSGSCCA